MIETSLATFTIEAQGVSTEDLYVQSAKLNGAPLLSAELTQADLVDGGKLVLVMGVDLGAVKKAVLSRRAWRTGPRACAWRGSAACCGSVVG